MLPSTLDTAVESRYDNCGQNIGRRASWAWHGPAVARCNGCRLSPAWRL